MQKGAMQESFANQVSSIKAIMQKKTIFGQNRKKIGIVTEKTVVFMTLLIMTCILEKIAKNKQIKGICHCQDFNIHSMLG